MGARLVAILLAAVRTLSSLRTGRYVGEADLTLAPQRRAECFAPEALERLGKLRAIYDPGGLFFAWP